MQSKMEKLVQGIKKGPAFLKELREFDALVKSIGECKSKAEEDRIITQELEVLKQRLSDPKLDKTRGREYMVRAIYCEMLGHDASFAYIKALQFASDPNIHTKKVGLRMPPCGGVLGLRPRQRTPGFTHEGKHFRVELSSPCTYGLLSRLRTYLPDWSPLSCPYGALHLVMRCMPISCVSRPPHKSVTEPLSSQPQLAGCLPGPDPVPGLQQQPGAAAGQHAAQRPEERQLPDRWGPGAWGRPCDPAGSCCEQRRRPLPRSRD